MKKKNLLGLLIIIIGLVVTGCNSSNGIDTGIYKAFKTVQCVEEGCGEEATEEEIKQEGWNVTLEVRSNKTATFKWTGTQIKEPSIVNFTIKKDKMVDDDGNEYSYSYINGVIKIETENGTTWWFK